MVPGQLLEFTPSDFLAAWRLVEELDGVQEVQTYGAMLHVFVDDVHSRGPEIEAVLSDQRITCQGLREIAPGMEEAFMSLVRRQSEADAESDS
jgi:hypothetical protein